MRATFHRYLRDKLSKPQQQSPSESCEFTNRIDSRLKDMNRSFVPIKLQEIYLDIVNGKRTIRSKQIKQFYHLFTQNKAEALIFNHHLQQPNSQQLHSDPQQKEAITDTKRLYCRLIQKLMVKVHLTISKISYYLMYSRKLGFLHHQTTQLVKRCELLMRRLNFIRDGNNINEVIEEIFQENQDIQEQIIAELVDKGYLVSADQFYRVNGVDLEHREYFQRHLTTQEQNSQELNGNQDVMKSMKKFQFNLQKVSSSRNLCISKTKLASSKKINPFKQTAPLNCTLPPSRPSQRSSHSSKTFINKGLIQIEDKYRQLLVNIEQIIQTEALGQITEERDSMQENKDNNGDDQGSAVQNDQEDVLMRKVSTRSKKMKASQQLRTSRNKYPTILTPKTKVLDLNLDFRTQFTPSNQSAKRRGRFQDQQSSNNNTSHYLPDSSNTDDRIIERHQTLPFFSKTFVGAIKTMQKMNVRDANDRIGLKRMSEQLITISKKEQIGISNFHSNKKVTVKNSIQRARAQNYSINKLLNIYKNRKEQEMVASIKQEIIESKKQQFVRSYSKEPSPRINPFRSKINIKANLELQYPPSMKVISLKKLNTKDIIKKCQEKSIFLPLHKPISGTATPNLQNLQEFQQIPLKNQQLSTFRGLRWTDQPRTPRLSNDLLKARIQISPNRKEKELCGSSIFTPMGIGKATVERSDSTGKLNKSQTEEVVYGDGERHYQVYDRTRMVFWR